MNITRTLRKNSVGADVRELKEWLFSNGYYAAKVRKITHNRYGADTVKAVKTFQSKYALASDGIFGPKSREMLRKVLNNAVTADTEYVTAEKYPRISEENRRKINTELNGTTPLRRKIVLEALNYATDAAAASKYRYPSSPTY